MIYGKNTVTSLNETTEDFLKGCNPSNVIPAYAGINEMSYFVIEAAEQDFNSVMESIGISELHHLEETATEVIYEEAESEERKTIINKIVDWIKARWKDFQNMIQKFLKMVDDAINKVAKMFNGRIDNAMKVIKDETKFGTTYLYTDFAKAADKVTSEVAKVSKEFKDHYNKYINQTRREDKAYGNIDDYEAKIKKSQKSINIGVKYDKIGELKGKYIAKIRGNKIEITGKYVKANFKEYEDYALRCGKLKSDVKKTYNDAKKVYNGLIGELKKIDKPDFDARAALKLFAAYKHMTHILTICEQATLTCMNEKRRHCVSVILRVATTFAAFQKKEKKAKDEIKAEVQHNSATYTADRINSLFEW